MLDQTNEKKIQEKFNTLLPSLNIYFFTQLLLVDGESKGMFLFCMKRTIVKKKSLKSLKRKDTFSVQLFVLRCILKFTMLDVMNC